MNEQSNQRQAPGLQARPDGDRAAMRRAFRIVLVYFLIGCAWILITDNLSFQLFESLPDVLRLSTFKGLLFVAATSVLIFALVYTPLRRLYAVNRTLEHQQSLMKSFLDASEDLIYYADKEGRYLGCNAAYERFIGTPEEALIGNPVHNPETRQGKYEAEAADFDGAPAVFEVLNAPYRDGDGEYLGTISIGRDVTERRNREEHIRHISTHDALTGLYNRHYFEGERARLSDSSLLPLSVVVCDVDGLKLINDAFGHAAGDEILLWGAEILRASTRPGDVVIRSGGDEYYAFFPETSAEEIEKIVEAMIASTKRRDGSEPLPLGHTGLSIGYATRETEEEALEDAIIVAEGFMYRRKLLARKSVHSHLMQSITASLHEKSLETHDHCGRMSAWARALGIRMNIPHRDLDTLELAASLHDIGKIGIDLSILQKSGKLTSDEWQTIRKHPEAGWRITQAIPELNGISEIILTHHERWDGSGYPKGLAGQEIPLMARIISVVDAYDAMTEDRPYRRRMEPQAAVEELLAMAGSQFDPDVVGIFVEQILAAENTR